MKNFPLLCLISVLQIFAALGGLQAESEAGPGNVDVDAVSNTGVEQEAQPESKERNTIPDDDLEMFTPETRASILRERQLAVLNRNVFGDFRDRDGESSEETEEVDEIVTEIGLITLQEYIVIPWESREAERLLAEGLVLYTEEARERILKEKYLSLFDRDFLNRWQIPFMGGTSAAQRARMYEEEARFARFEELTKKFLATLKESRGEAYKDLKKLYLEDRYDRLSDQRSILGLHGHGDDAEE